MPLANAAPEVQLSLRMNYERVHLQHSILDDQKCSNSSELYC